MNEIMSYTYANPAFFWLFLLLPFLVYYYIYYQKKKLVVIHIPFSDVSSQITKSWKERLIHVPFVFRLLSLSLLIIVLARPQLSNVSTETSSEGIDIVMALDISASMLAEDFKPNRIEAAKKVATKFIASRPSDRIGLVIFSGESFTQCPTTTDHDILINALNSVKSGLLEDGTAIGEGLATSISRLKDSDAKSKVIILLTDGVNNLGSVSPETAGEIAKTFGIRVYTIGIGSNGYAPYPIQTPFGKEYQRMPVQIDEVVLKKIAGSTDGKYYRATGNNELSEIYTEIDKLEKSKVKVEEWKSYIEKYHAFLWLAMLLLCLELLLSNTILRRSF